VSRSIQASVNAESSNTVSTTCGKVLAALPLTQVAGVKLAAPRTTNPLTESTTALRWTSFTVA